MGTRNMLPPSRNLRSMLSKNLTLTNNQQSSENDHISPKDQEQHKKSFAIKTVHEFIPQIPSQSSISTQRLN